MDIKTHREVKNPQVSARYLAEYMSASERVKRSILRRCKYQSVVPVTQHRDARAIIANHLRLEKDDHAALVDKIDRLSRKICDTKFETQQRDHNVDYLRRFLVNLLVDDLGLPKAELVQARRLEPLVLNGTKVNFTPDLLVRRLTRANTVKIGAITFRYAKGQLVDPEAALYEAAFGFSYFRTRPFEAQAEPEHKLCIILDQYAGKSHPAPTDAVDRFNNMAAACETIADAWAAVKPPAGAIL